MIVALILLPMLAGAVAFFLHSGGLRRGLLIAVAITHTGLTGFAWLRTPAPAMGGWLLLDAPGLLFHSRADFG